MDETPSAKICNLKLADFLPQIHLPWSDILSQVQRPGSMLPAQLQTNIMRLTDSVPDTTCAGAAGTSQEDRGGEPQE